MNCLLGEIIDHEFQFLSDLWATVSICFSFINEKKMLAGLSVTYWKELHL